tara:strand:- start:414210 stop:415319 length:1110 start_codon:yes stop_codon:yes gene_type:complete
MVSRTARVAVFACLALAAAARATTVQDLLDSNQLEIHSSISPKNGLVPGQKATLTLEIATDSWFTGGTRIKVPEVAGLVILQTDQFASNASENRAGVNWVIQRWTLDIYPQREGDFIVNPIPLSLSINGGDAGNVEGEALSPAISFSVAIPAALSQAESWVAAPRYSATQQFDRSLDDLQVGDAFQRDIIFEAQDVMAMMLPSFNAEQLSGLAAYPEPPKLENNSNRGEVVARKRVSISYVVESEGSFELPEQEYLWWDTQQQQLQLLTLPATNIVVGSGVNPAQVPQVAKLPQAANARWGVIAGALLLLVFSVWAVRSQRYKGRVEVVVSWLAQQWQRCKALKEPALPQQLNPGSLPSSLNHGSSEPE